MNVSRLISLACIIIGGAIALYAQAEEQQNTFVLMIGIVLLILGVYRISRRIPSKSESSQEENFVKSEPIDPKTEAKHEEL